MAEKAAADKAAADKAAAQKAAAQKAATERVAQEKLAAEKAAAERAAAEKAATEKAAVEKVATERAAVERVATERAATKRASTPAAARMEVRVACPQVDEHGGDNQREGGGTIEVSQQVTLDQLRAMILEEFDEDQCGRGALPPLLTPHPSPPHATSTPDQAPPPHRWHAPLRAAPARARCAQAARGCQGRRRVLLLHPGRASLRGAGK